MEYKQLGIRINIMEYYFLFAFGVCFLLFLVSRMWSDPQAREWKQFKKDNPIMFVKLPLVEKAFNEPTGGCPCLYTTPCHPRCTCRYTGSSNGCLYCCTYGSLEQRTQHAEWIVNRITSADKKV